MCSAAVRAFQTAYRARDLAAPVQPALPPDQGGLAGATIKQQLEPLLTMLGNSLIAQEASQCRADFERAPRDAGEEQSLRDCRDLVKCTNDAGDLFIESYGFRSAFGRVSWRIICDVWRRWGV